MNEINYQVRHRDPDEVYLSNPEKYQHLYEKLSTEERGLVFSLSEKTQKQVAANLGMTQGAISARISKIQKKLRFLDELSKIDDSKLEEDLGKYLTKLGVDIIRFMKETTSQSRTADLINEKYGLRDEETRMTQVKIRYRFERCTSEIHNLAKINPEMQKYCDLLAFLKSHLYMFQGWRKSGVEEVKQDVLQ